MGQGYIRLDGNRLVFFHRSDTEDHVFNTLLVDDDVTFELIEDRLSGARAIRVRKPARAQLTSALRVWQRHHTPDIVAEVRPVSGIGTWDVCAWRDVTPPEKCEGGRYGLLTEAHRAADALAATTFNHRCDTSCGEWNASDRRHGDRG
jgi:cold shock CspA family protein